MLSNLAAHLHGCCRISRSRPDPEVIKLFFMHNSTEHEISTAHKLKCRQIKKFLALSLSGVVFIMLINVIMPTIVGIFNIYEQHKYRAQLS